LQALNWLPDGDDIGFTIPVAFKIQKRTLLFNFLRKNVAVN